MVVVLVVLSTQLQVVVLHNTVYLLIGMFIVFVFKQKTAYEMRISDWSSDVCSSDLCGRATHSASAIVTGGWSSAVAIAPSMPAWSKRRKRSEERSVGKECVSTCRSWWWPDHSKKNKQKNEQAQNA